MFNHGRTLLLNLSSDTSHGPDFPGEELIPAEYAPIELPDYLRRIRFWLFGNAPDRAMLNYRGRQLLALVHSTELEQYLLDLDPRITYTIPNERDLVLEDTFQPTVTQYSGPASDLTIVGSPAAPDVSGRMQYDFHVDVLNATTVQVTRLNPPVTSTNLDLVLTDGLSNEFELPDVGWKFRIATDNPGSAWRIGGFLRPDWPLGSIASAVSQVGEPTLLSLFGVARAEPFETLWNLWQTSTELPYRLGALVTAVILRTEQLRIAA